MKIAVLFFLMFFGATKIWAQSEGILNQLLAPGPLITGHAKLEGKDCLKCHEAGKGVAQQLCVDCHKEIKKQLATKKGFHSLAIETQACIACHTDHKGRENDTTKIEVKGFDHFLKTGYDLKGKHSELKCEKCHTEKRTEMAIRKSDIRFLAKSSTCVSCHKKEDVHFYKGTWAEKDCNACHSNTSWKKEITFNHNTDTKFKLTEKHADLKCNDCHVVDKKLKTFQYQWPKLEQNQCLSCHKDFHKNNLSPKFSDGKCGTCHNQTKWTIAKFNHDVTNFKLREKHEVAQCIECHKTKVKLPKNTPVKELNFTGLKQNCTSCHEDYHKFGSPQKFKIKDIEQCLKCHNESSWKKTHHFDHAKNAEYPLDGKHTDLKCNTCHLPKNPPLKNIVSLLAPTYQWKNLGDKTCETCHKSPHIGEFSKEMQAKKCNSCHTTEGWLVQKAGGFDHEKSRFPLTGSHKTTRCSECHGPTGKQIFKFKSVENKFCVDCHNNIHIGQFSFKTDINNCSECHNTNSFKKDIKFDHNQTLFKLLGKHSDLKCSECHVPTNENYQVKWPNFHLNTDQTKLSELAVSKSKFKFTDLKEKQCMACHQDYHAGQLGNNCSQCHSETGWKPAKFDHSTQSQFNLKGKHKDLKCAECHKAIEKAIVFSGKKILVTRYKPLGANCIECHQDYHAGQLGNNCSQCHSEQSWKKTNFVHNTNSRFKLFNKHAEIKCQDCHKPTEQKIIFKEITQFVVKYKPINANCYECHKDPHKGSFGRQCVDCHTDKSWKATKDFHKNFSLTGVHYTLDCNECHNGGKKLAGLSQNCLSCHQKDDIHNGTLPNCKSCHNQQFWDVAAFKHSMTRFPLRGAHRVLDCSECHRNGVYKGLSSTCVSCHLSDFQAYPVSHSSGNTSCTDCHRNTFTFKDSSN